MDELDRAFHALADPTRRAMIERLSRGPASVKELAAPFSIALPSVLKHLAVLEADGLVRSEKTGRVRTYRMEPEVLARLGAWVSERCATWNHGLGRPLVEPPTRARR